MQDSPHRDQVSPTSSLLPPLSKYYYGPAQGRNSPQKVTYHQSLGWDDSSTSARTSTELSPQPQSPTTYNAKQWMNHFASQDQASWQHHPGPPPSAPAANNVPVSSYNPNAYGLMPGGQQPPRLGWSPNASPGFPPDTRSWGVHHNRQHNPNYGEDQSPKPPLPPRPRDSYQSSHHSQQPSYSSGHSYDSPNLGQLQQGTYNPHAMPSYDHQSDTNSLASPPVPSRIPPAPPPLPPEYHTQLQQNRPSQYSAQQQPTQQHSSAPHNQYLDAPHGEQLQASQSIPSNGEYSDQYSDPHQSFVSHPAHLSNQTEVSVPLRFDDSFAYQSSQQENEQSVSPVNDTDRWRPDPGQEGNQLAFFPSPMPEAATLAKMPASQQGHGTSSVSTQGWGQQVQEQQGDGDQAGRSQAPPSTDAKRPSLAHNRDDSFYWHSDPPSAQPSRTASSNAQVNSTLAKQPIPHPQPTIPVEEIHRRDSETLSGIPSLAHSPMPAYGASALGFGGPSDWEHFGDYEAEDIDYTERYTKAKPTAADRVPELPADVSPTDRGQRDNVPAKQEPVPASFIPPSPPKPTHDDAVVVGPIVSVEDQPRQHGPNDVRHFEAQGSKSTTQYQPRMKTSVAAMREKSYATEEPSASQQNTRESEISISDFPLPDNKRPAPLEERQQSVAASEISPNDPLRKDWEHVIETWTRPDQESVQKKVEEDEPEKPRALNFSPNVAQSASTKATEQKANETRLGGNVANGTFKLDSAVKDNHQNPDAREPVPPKHHDEIQPASTKPGENAESTSQRGNGSSAGSKLDVPSDVTPKRATSSKRNSMIDVRSSENSFDDLDPWAIASLNRYVAMLREESRAETNESKFKIFTVFTTRETRLRAVLYEAEEKKEGPAAPVVENTSLRRSNTESEKHALKALPALPPNASVQNGAEAFTLSRTGSKTGMKHGSRQESVSLPKLETVAQGTTSGIGTEPKEAIDDAQYSPGGRPLVERPPRRSIVGDAKITDGNDTTDGVTRDGLEEPAYKPFKYEQGRSEVKAYAANRLSKRNSQYRPYAQLTSEPEPPIPVDADMLAKQKDVQDSALKDAPKDTINEVPKERQLPLSLVTAPKSKFRVNGIPDPTNVSESPNTQPIEEVKPDLRQFVNADFDPLTAILPKDDVRNETPAQLLDLKNIIDLVPDEFGFIHQAVLAWDVKARQRREVNERERHARQVESEQRIDALFDDHDIGYGDISELESEFKRNEASRKADEDRGEYQTFVSEVFDVVWTRLHFEIDQLGPHYKRFTDLLDSTTAGQDIFVDKPDNLPLAPTMDALLTLHQKLEIRHQKAFEAVLERDRRLKKTEVSPWYTLGNVSKVKQLERQFETAEKRAIVDYCSQRDVRANSLMDVIDQNTLRGVGTNQDYMELIMKAVRRIASGRAFASTPRDTQPDVGLPEVHKAQAVTKALTISSEQIVQTFHVADMLLNAADYEVSVAKSKQSGADRATFERLKEERAKEDQKLMKDLQHRLALIRDDSRKTHDEIVKLLVFLGAQGGQTGNENVTKPLPDPSHQERLQKALEEAKRRNERVNGVG